MADLELDEDGKAIKDKAGNDADEEGVIILESAAARTQTDALNDDAPPVGKLSRAEAAAYAVKHNINELVPPSNNADNK